MFVLTKLLGGQEMKEELPASNVAITKGDCLYFASGYLSNAYSSITVALLAGIAQQTVDNSGGSAGDKVVLFEASPLACYEVGTGDTMTQAYVGYNCALASASTITSASQGTDITGVVKIRRMISASKVFCSLNFGTTADT